MTKDEFVRALEAVALNSEGVARCDVLRYDQSTDQAAEAMKAKMDAYADRRNAQMDDLHAFFDTVQTERASLVAVVEAATAWQVARNRWERVGIDDGPGTIDRRLFDAEADLDNTSDTLEAELFAYGHIRGMSATVATTGRAQDGEGGTSGTE